MRVRVKLECANPDRTPTYDVQVGLLSRLFLRDPAVAIREGETALQSTVIDRADEELDSTFHDVVREQIRLVDEVAALLIPGYQTGLLSVRGYAGARERGTRLRIYGIRMTGIPAVLPRLSAANAATVLDLAANNPDLDRALLLLARADGDTVWYDLWSVYDIVRYDLTDPAWVKARWSEDRERRFRASANQRVHSGDRARHQDSRGDPHVERVDSDEAREWLRDLLLAYVSERSDNEVVRAG